MKQHLIFILLLFISSCSCCNSGDDDSYRETRFKTNLSPNFIPILAGTTIFQSDSGKTIQFDEIKTTHEFIDADQCEAEECCTHIVNYEYKHLLLTSTKENMSVVFSMRSGDSSDYILSSMYKISQDYSDFEPARINLDLKNIINDTDSNCVFIDTIVIQQKIYRNIYEFRLKYEGYENKRHAKSLFYSKTNGLVGFILDDKSVWTKK